MLRVSGASHDHDSVREAFDVVDTRGELGVVLLNLERAQGASSVYGALSVVRDCLLSRAPTYEVVGALRSWCAEGSRDAVVAITLVRFAQPDSRVEVLCAGMPAVVYATPGGHLGAYWPLSPAVGAHSGEVHPYELCPLIWGSTWFLMSNGVTQGPLETDSSVDLVRQHALAERGAELSGLSPTELRPWLRRLAGGPLHADASFVVVHADPTRRFQSGVR